MRLLQVIGVGLQCLIVSSDTGYTYSLVTCNPYMDVVWSTGERSKPFTYSSLFYCHSLTEESQSIYLTLTFFLIKFDMSLMTISASPGLNDQHCSLSIRGVPLLPTA
jgi:hypothetical protein